MMASQKLGMLIPKRPKVVPRLSTQEFGLAPAQTPKGIASRVAIMIAKSASEPVEKIAEHANRSKFKVQSSRSFAGRIRALNFRDLMFVGGSSFGSHFFACCKAPAKRSVE